MLLYTGYQLTSMRMWDQLLSHIKEIKPLSRAISLVENEVPGYLKFLASLTPGQIPVWGITGPPGAGKSTLTDALLGHLVEAGKKIAVICIDPSSPFHLGALLGDRIRLSRWYNHENVFIRSLANKGQMGGLHPKIIEITELLKASMFDTIIIETVGVGQSEIEISGLADETIVVLVPEAGDEVQTMKAGLMEIADIFVINKSDRPGADQFANNLRKMLAPAFSKTDQNIPVFLTSANRHEGITALYNHLALRANASPDMQKKAILLTEKAWQLIQQQRMKDIDKKKLFHQLEIYSKAKSFNLFRFLLQQYPV